MSKIIIESTFKCMLEGCDFDKSVTTDAQLGHTDQAMTQIEQSFFADQPDLSTVNGLMHEDGHPLTVTHVVKEIQ